MLLGDAIAVVALAACVCLSVCLCLSVGHLSVFLGELGMVEATRDKGEMSIEWKERVMRYGQGEGRSMEDDTGWSEPRIDILHLQSMAVTANHSNIDLGHKYPNEVWP